jgi:hypothetical protein
MIMDSNELAMKTLTSNRVSLPIYHSLGQVHTPTIYLNSLYKKYHLKNVIITRAKATQAEEVFSFINEYQACYQFSPYYNHHDLGRDRLLGLDIRDFHLAIKDNKLIGVVAAWDQTKYKQTHIESYSSYLKLVKPLYNILSYFTSLNRIPDIGNYIPYFYIAFIAIKYNDPAVFRALLSALYQEYNQQNWHYVICGLHENHPLLSVLSDYKSIKTYGNLFGVYFADDAIKNPFDNIQGVPNIEIATL